MKIKIWSMTTETIERLQTQLFLTEQQLKTAVFDWLSTYDTEERTAEEIAAHFNGDMILADEEIRNDEYYLKFDCHEVEIPADILGLIRHEAIIERLSKLVERADGTLVEIGEP